MKLTAVIMAGGKGERFWPKSRVNCPKQFLSLTADGETMIQKTVRRLSDLIASEDMYILTNQDYLDLVRQQLPDLPEENLLAEPCPRNTAPCIGLAASVIAKKYQDAVMIVLPSDHLIHAEEIYLNTLRYTPGRAGPLRRKFSPHPPGLESVSGPAAGRTVAGASPNQNRGL